MENQAFNALCIEETKIFASAKVLLSDLIYELIPIRSNMGTVGYDVKLNGENMGSIRPEQFKSNFVRTTLTGLDELHKIDRNMEVNVWSEMPCAI